jgi:hypothetical protein
VTSNLYVLHVFLSCIILLLTTSGAGKFLFAEERWNQRLKAAEGTNEAVKTDHNPETAPTGSLSFQQQVWVLDQLLDPL